MLLGKRDADDPIEGYPCTVADCHVTVSRGQLEHVGGREPGIVVDLLGKIELEAVVEDDVDGEALFPPAVAVNRSRAHRVVLPEFVPGQLPVTRSNALAPPRSITALTAPKTAP